MIASGRCFTLTRLNTLISANNLSIQFGAKPLFENVSATFGNGNRYGLIGANVREIPRAGRGDDGLREIVGRDAGA